MEHLVCADFGIKSDLRTPVDTSEHSVLALAFKPSDDKITRLSFEASFEVQVGSILLSDCFASAPLSIAILVEVHDSRTINNSVEFCCAHLLLVCKHLVEFHLAGFEVCYITEFQKTGFGTVVVCLVFHSGRLFLFLPTVCSVNHRGSFDVLTLQI